MTRISCKWRAAVAAPAAAATLMIAAFGAHAAHFKVLSSVALTSALDELAPVFERTTGNKLVIDYGVAAQLRDRFLTGEAADVLILTRPLMDDLQKQGKVITGSLMNVGGTAVAVAVRAGARKPTSALLKRSSGQRDCFYGRDQSRYQNAGSGQGADPVSHRIGCCTDIES